jgi:hypothetical protein
MIDGTKEGKALIEQMEGAYRRMAEEARYRPRAPSDGLGNITVPVEKLDLNAEANRYARDWWVEEDGGGVPFSCARYAIAREGPVGITGVVFRTTSSDRR